jgi:squalene cyclase
MPDAEREHLEESHAKWLLSDQQANGCWSTACDAGPASTAKVLVALRFSDQLDAFDRGKLIKLVQKLLSAQFDEGPMAGGFPPWPVAGPDELGDKDLPAVRSATAAVLAGLHASGIKNPEVTRTIDRARAFLADPEFRTIIARGSQGDFTALYLAMADLIDVRDLPSTPIVFRLTPGSEYILEQRVNLLMPLQLLSYDAIVAYLKAGKRPPDTVDLKGFAASVLSVGRGSISDLRLRAGQAFSTLVGSANRVMEGWRSLPGTLPSFVEGERLKLLLRRYENADGSWLYGDSVSTSLALAALHAVGTPEDDRRIKRAVRWLVGLVDENFVPLFRTDVWTTAFRVRAIMTLGIPPWDERVARALKWLMAAQRQGSWAFQAGNTALPDIDDSAMALASLAIAYDIERKSIANDRGSRGFGTTMRANLERALLEGRAWLLQRQNADGGWASFQTGLPSKPPGAFMTKPPVMPKDSVLARWDFLLDPPADMGDPAVEDVTGRVLFALGKLGMRSFDPQIVRAIEFLRRNQLDSGAFWGRWVVTYVPATSWILRGLASVEADLTEPWVVKAIRFLQSCQNEGDGGWGEDLAVVRDPKLAGQGRSTLFHTGSAVSALLEVQPLSDRTSYRRGIDFIRAQPRADRDGVVFPLMPPESFYTMPGISTDVAAEAIGLLDGIEPHAVSGKRRPFRPEPASLPFQQMLGEGDDAMAAVIHELKTAGELDALFKALAAADKDQRPALSPTASKALDAVTLKTTVSDADLKTAQDLFQRCGWGVAASLFCTSLPQCFCFAKGAKVLAGTGRLEFVPQRRIIETMQFVFDVATSNRSTIATSALRVRMMHEVIRQEVLGTPEFWNRELLGQPINQQQLLATMLSFSTMVMDGLRALGLRVEPSEEEAWLRVWLDVGRMLGIKPEYFQALRSTAMATDVLEQLRDLEWERSPQGARLATALVEMMQSFLPSDHISGLPVALTRHLAGDRCADLLELPEADWTGLLLQFGRPVAQFAEFFLDFSPVGYLGRALSFALLEGLAAHLREAKNASFRIPEDLLARWRRELSGFTLNERTANEGRRSGGGLRSAGLG